MGIPLSREKRVSAQASEKKPAPDREFGHLSTLHELLNYKEEPELCVVEPLSDAIERGKPGDPRTIVCHDMDGDYEAVDKGTQSAPDEYLFHHWQVIDMFVCYSHHMVTIPPLGWISAAHKHGVKVLGSFILKEDDAPAINLVRGSRLTPQVAAQLVNVATVGRFDGWVIGIVCNLHPSSVPFLEDLLKAVTAEMHQAIPGSLVFWYGAIDVDGNVKPHNELNGKNACFLDLCDGILLNFRWTEATLQNSAQLAGSRKADVYVGIDVYARNTLYSGGYDMYNALEVVREYSLSAAIIGADWVYKQNKTMFRENKYLLWALPDHCSSQWRLKKLPLSTTFCQGFGASVYKQGRAVKQAPWFDIAKQELQPRDQGRKLCGGGGSSMVCTEDAYTGGSCLCLAYERKEAPGSRMIPYFRLFVCDLPLGCLLVSYTYKNREGGGFAGHDISMLLKVRNAFGKTEKLSLGSVIIVPEGENYTAQRSIGSSTRGGDLGDHDNGWLIRKYRVEDHTGSAVLEEIGISFISNEEKSFLLGELVLKRPNGAAGSSVAKDCGAETPRDDEGAGGPEEGHKPIAFDVSMSSDESD